MYKIIFYMYFILSLGLIFKYRKMGRKAITDGTKKKQWFVLIEERYYNLFGEKKLKSIFNNALNKEIEKLKHSKNPHQIDLTDSIAEIENQIQPVK